MPSSSSCPHYQISFNVSPHEIGLRVFEPLRRSTLLNAALVSKNWYRLAESVLLRQPQFTESLTEYQFTDYLDTYQKVTHRVGLGNRIRDLRLQPRDPEHMGGILALLIESKLEVESLTIVFATSDEIPLFLAMYPEKFRSLIAHTSECEFGMGVLHDLSVLDELICCSHSFVIRAGVITGPVSYTTHAIKKVPQIESFAFTLFSDPEMGEKLGHAFATHFSMPNLREFACRSSLNDEDLRRFLTPSLESLYVDGVLNPLRNVLNAAAATGCRLKTLAVDTDNSYGNVDMSDLNNADFRSVTGLRVLLLKLSYITAKGFKRLVTSTDGSLEVIDLKAPMWLNFRGVGASYFKSIVSVCPKLRALRFTCCKGFTSENMLELAGAFAATGNFKNLRVLDVSGCPLGSAAIVTFFSIVKPSLDLVVFSPNQIGQNYEHEILSKGWAHKVEWNDQLQLLSAMSQIAV